MIRLLLAFIRPISALTRELRLIRELYELDLGSRTPPIYRLTENPSRSDTEVSYTGEQDDRPLYKRWLQADDAEDKL